MSPTSWRARPRKEGLFSEDSLKSSIERGVVGSTWVFGVANSQHTCGQSNCRAGKCFLWGSCQSESEAESCNLRSTTRHDILVRRCKCSGRGSVLMISCLTLLFSTVQQDMWLGIWGLIYKMHHLEFP